LGHALHHYTGNLHLPQQRFTNPDGSQIIDPPPISPSHHYHYTQLPDNLNSLDRNGGGPLSTFSAARQQKTPPKYYDDPSPYATTTLINPENANNNLCCNRSQGPSLPLNPAPTEPPRHFLSSAAVMRPAAPYHHNNKSFNELLELENSWHNNKQQNKRIAAAATLQQRRLRKAFLVQHQHFGTTSRGGGTGGKRNNSGHSTQRRNNGEISYVHSCEGSNNNNLDEAPQYDPVMTESIHQLVVEASSRRRKREDKETYYDFSPAPNRPSRQPMMGVNNRGNNNMAIKNQNNCAIHSRKNYSQQNRSNGQLKDFGNSCKVLNKRKEEECGNLLFLNKGKSRGIRVYAQSQLNNLRNSEIECKSQNEVLLGQLKAAETKNDQQDKPVKEVRIQLAKNNKHPAIKELDLQHSVNF
uniref:Uncharacterized protein n=1 Tax=Meloidogyne javanica TaxID=6303 RepID=A0A915LE70_MELJA